MKTIIRSTLSIALLSLVLFSCKKTFDTPPFGGDIDPNLPVNKTIWELKQLYYNNNSKATAISDDITISGIVVANDESGNFYKQIIIQDSSSGIALNLNRASLYSDFPVGRKVYVKCKGLSIGAYGGFIQIGYAIDGTGSLTDIPSALIGDYVVKATYPNDINAVSMSIASLNTLAGNEALLGKLIKIETAQVISSELGLPFALTPDDGSGTDRHIEDCNGNVIVVRMSNYANFQAQIMPSGSGPLYAIYSKYNTTPQLLIRDAKDFNFGPDRCPFGAATDTLISIATLRSMYSGTTKVITDRKIRGTVISDLDQTLGDNITSRNMVVQDGDRGIVIRFASSADNTWALGDSLEILISGQSLSEFGNLLQVGDQVKGNMVQKLGTGNVTPRVTTIAQIIANFEDWESTLVTIPQANLVSGDNTTYQGTILLNDGSTLTNFPMFTQSYASFATVTAPIGQTKSITGFLYSISSANRISIRRLTDIHD